MHLRTYRKCPIRPRFTTRRALSAQTFFACLDKDTVPAVSSFDRLDEQQLVRVEGVEFQELGKGIVKRKERRVLGLFIDGTGLDRATRRINRKVDLTRLVRGVTSGIAPIVARYYTLIPYEDDSRQRAFLDAVDRAGLEVVVKRLPPKGVTRQVAVDVEMAADLVAFALGHQRFSDLSTYRSEQREAPPHDSAPAPLMPFGRGRPQRHEEPKPDQEDETQEPETPQRAGLKEKRIVTLVCPSRELAYPVSLVKELGVDTITADFGQFNTGDLLKSAAKWIDLSDSETIWRE